MGHLARIQTCFCSSDRTLTHAFMAQFVLAKSLQFYIWSLIKYSVHRSIFVSLQENAKYIQWEKLEVTKSWFKSTDISRMN